MFPIAEKKKAKQLKQLKQLKEEKERAKAKLLDHIKNECIIEYL